MGSGYLTYQGSRLTTTVGSDGTLTAVDSHGTAVFTISGDIATDRYVLTLLHELDPAFVTSATFGSITAGNNNTYTLADSQNTFVMTLTGFASNGSASTINTNNGAIGVGNNSMETAERLVFDFTSSPTTVTGIGFTAQNLGAAESVTWRAYDAGGAQVGAGTLSGSGSNSSDSSWSLDAATNFGGSAIARIEFGAGGGTSYKFVLNSLSGSNMWLDQTIGLQATAQDSDGDASAMQSFGMTFTAGHTIDGTAGDDAIGGSTGADRLAGSNGNDLLWSGAGNDTLTGGAGSDVFAWRLGDAGSPGSPATDTVTDFNNANGGDVLDLRDLLVGEDAGNLANYLHFSVAGGSTTISISSTGGFSGGYSSAAVDQVVTLQNVDLVGALGNDAAVITDLISRGKLITDQG
jgi:Ca2+-binding RTX toxin-like protein